jgi:glycine/serine hydroxymethyltransferase
MGEAEVALIVKIMDAAMVNKEDSQILNQAAKDVQDLCHKFPIYR